MPTSTQRHLERLGRAPLTLAVAITSPPRPGATGRPAGSGLLTLVGPHPTHGTHRTADSDPLTPVDPHPDHPRRPANAGPLTLVGSRPAHPADRPATTEALTLVGPHPDHPGGRGALARLGDQDRRTGTPGPVPPTDRSASVHRSRRFGWLTSVARLAGQRLDSGPARGRSAIHGDSGRDDRGQATAEYGLIILAAGGIALGVIAWASGTGSFTDLFDSVVGKLSDSL
jgi:hypothetical protein